MRTVIEADASHVRQDLLDYDEERRTFSWSDARARLSTGGRTLNIAAEAVDRHLDTPTADRVAIRWLPRTGTAVELTYADLAAETSRFADAVSHLAAHPAPRVATLLGRRPELYVAALGTLKAGGVYSPLFSAFGPDPVKQRMLLGGIEVLVTTAPLYERKVAPVRAELPGLRHIILIDADATEPGTGLHDWTALLRSGSPEFPAAQTAPDDLALLHFTSGTTGNPKGAMHVHEAVVAHRETAQSALDLHDDDVFWCTADPGWVTGTSYGIIAPLALGVTSIIDEGDFDVERWYRIVEERSVTVWYTAPTAVRMMMRAGLDVSRAFDLSSLRVVASVGEPLNPEAVAWGREAFGMPILDNWWQTETGGIMIANFLDTEVKPGSMGRPVPGIDATILARVDGELVLDAAGDPVEVESPDEVGELALRTGWPSMFRGYLGMQERYARSFAGDWYRSGDLARRDADGYYWFVGRSDDLIKTAGHLVGPFEVESALIEHPAVSEAAVIGIPDPTAGEIIKAFVSLAEGVTADDELLRDVRAFARTRLGPAIAPRELVVVDRLPKTRSGKIMRRLLKARELGLPEGDTSTLEEGEQS